MVVDGAPTPDQAGEARPLPGPLRGPFTRWPRAADAVLAAVVFALSLLAAILQDVDESDGVDMELVGVPAGAYVIVLGGAVALIWRRRRPIAVLAAALAGTLLWALLGYVDRPEIVLLVALYSVGRHEPDDRSSLVAVGVTAFVFAVGGLVDGDPLVETGVAVAMAWLPWYVGRRLRIRSDFLLVLQDRAMQLEREQQAQAERAVAEERARIARELHDVVAHRVSMMTVQAGAARTIVATEPDEAAEAMAAVEHAGRQALGELRHLLGVLRPSGAPEGLGPQAGVAALPQLLDELRSSGIDVALHADGVARELPGPVDLAAFRIVQESLTNVYKHAGCGARAEVRLGWHASSLIIEVTDDGAGATTVPGSGFGIVGMRERVAVLGGTLEAGTRPGGGFRLFARLPLTTAHPVGGDFDEEDE